MQQDRILRVALDWAVDEIDPPRSFGGWNTGRVVQQTHESLVEDDFDTPPSPPDAATRIVPRLATRVENSADARRFVFHLRQDVRFHDGAPLDAHAVVVNYERMIRRDSPHYSPVVADFNRTGVESIEHVRALDTNTVEFMLDQPFPEFLRYMTQEDAPGAQSLISPLALHKWGPDGCADRAPGTGAFRFDRRFDTAGGSAVALSRNASYWDGPPSIDGIRFLPFLDTGDRVRALVEGRVDVAYGVEGADLDDLSARGFVVPAFSPPYLWYLVFNLRDEHMNDVRVRQAIACAIDKEALCRALFPGAAQPATSAIPPGAPAHDASAPERYPYDPARARALLNAAGVVDTLTLRVVAARAGSAQLNPGAIYDCIARDLAKVGIDLEVTLHADWVAYCNQWREGAPTGIAFSEMSWAMSCDLWLSQVLHGKNASPRGFNAGYNADSVLDTLLDRARGTVAAGDRSALYRAADARVMETLPILPLFTSRRGMIAWSSRVTGMTVVNQCWQDFRRIGLK
ncbi:ABC transporter substrate-binding protein [Paraburkholderia fungorum]|uniref:ABC transporter substrate-binding protein n=1 Tax=Paraburkholderia fungorum TaxID=134537 RepID=A0AAP5QH34_9BURK|nr:MULTISPECIES: ABC transporter substrate-binding protein [Paraburkholderia]MDR8399465.1 ABC transporter substrate-binding protein [Paraburkholderia sp. USG1]MDT8843580.1 ABC transporter substrate-binding protein [Paraburkholderia fungorum]